MLFRSDVAVAHHVVDWSCPSMQAVVRLVVGQVELRTEEHRLASHLHQVEVPNPEVGEGRNWHLVEEGSRQEMEEQS